MLITNNTGSVLTLNNILVSGLPLIVTGTSLYVSDSLLVDGAYSIIDKEFGTSVTTSDAITNASIVSLPDSATTLAATNTPSTVYTITPTAARAVTTRTATQLVADIESATVGTTVEIVIANLAAFAVTLTAGSGVTIVGNAVTNASSGTFLVVITNVTTPTVSIFRK